MDFISNIVSGFSVALNPLNLGLALVGCLIGTLVGVLPGIGPVTTIALLLPVTFYLDPTSGLIMLAGIYYGAAYGGSTAAILLNIPGENSAVMTCIDGHQMAKQNRAGPALAIAAIGSLFAGSVATFFIALFAPPLANVGLAFGAPEYFSLLLLGLMSVVILARGSIPKALAMAVVGLLLGTVGMGTGTERFTFDSVELMDGIGFVPVAIGIFGLSEIIANLIAPAENRVVVSSKIGSLWPTRDDWRRSWPAILRGTGIGSALGILPGGGVSISTFAAYAVEKKVAKDSSRFGKGAIEGVAGPESANNAAAQTSFIPMLTLGIPGGAVMAVMIGGLMIHGIQPGPRVMIERPDLFWGLIASMWVGNLMLLVINLPLIGIWIQLLKVPYRYLYLAILTFACLGVYTLNNSVFEVGMAAFFGAVGYACLRLGCELPPLMLGLVLGPLMEENLRRAMRISGGDPRIFIDRPISLALLVVTVALFVVLLLPRVRKTKDRLALDDA